MNDTCPIHDVVIPDLLEDVKEIKERLREEVRKFNSRQELLDEKIGRTKEMITDIKDVMNKLVIKVLLVVGGGLFAAIVAMVWFWLQFLVTKS
jgi:prefoldin subunit 5